MVKSKAPRELAAHEKILYEQGLLEERSHKNSTSRWFYAPLGCSSNVPRVKQENVIGDEETVLVYRHMGDTELGHLVANDQLPATQPYQTIVRGEAGFNYCHKYFVGKKKVNVDVVSIVEFCCPKSLVDELFNKFHKAEDGCLSTGLGWTAGKTLPIFNAALEKKWISYRPVLVKRKRRK